MARKINHHKHLKTIRSIAAVRYMGIGEIVRFTYQKKNVTDSKPLVMIIHKEKDYVKGINLNYLTEYRVQQLLQEDIKIQDKRKKGKMLTNVRWYEVDDQFIRTYQIDKI